MYQIEETQIYLDIIEKLRKEKKIALLDFIEDITSERSYRRYLTHELDIPLEILEKLMQRLDLTAVDLIIYTLQVERKPSGVIELIQYTYHHALPFAEPYFNDLKNYAGDTKELKGLVDYFKALYRFKLEGNRETFHEDIRFLETFTLDDLEKLEPFSLYVLKHIHFNEAYDPIIHEIFLTKQLFLYHINLYNLILDMYLNHYLDSAYFDLKEYEALVHHYYETAHKWTDAYSVYGANYHHAKLAYLKHDVDGMKPYLFTYLQHHTLTQSQPLDEKKRLDIETMLQMDIKTFLIQYVHTLHKV